MVTGGSGLIGSEIEAEFKPTRYDLNLLNLDSIVNYLVENKIDKIIHCAGKVGGIGANSNKLGEFYTENILINTNLLEAARIAKVDKVVSFLSTCVFPSNAKFPLSVEQIHLGPPHSSNYAYAYAKRMVEVQSRAYRDQYGCNFVTIIPCNIYGPNDNYHLEDGHVIPALIHKIYNAKVKGAGWVNVWGSGKPYREFLYSKDAAYLAKRVLDEYNKRYPLIISPDEEIQISILIEEICRRIGFEGEVYYSKDKDGQYRKPSDNTQMKKLFPEYTITPIEVGLKNTIEYFIKHYDEVRK
jgi:GDP-L-fucose synthase